MHEKKLPYVIKAEFIRPEEAKQVRHDAYNEVKKLLKNLNKDLTKLTVTGKNGSQKNLDQLIPEIG
jgi:hypothetical protein